MPFRVSVHLLEPAYQAAGAYASRAEWPPHPSRLFCGLVSVADPADAVQDLALRWLQEQPAPRVRVPAGTAEAEEARRSWVVTNAIGKSSHAVLPGRMSSGMRQWPQRSLEQPLVEFEWAAEPPAGVAAVLEMLAKANPYIGRATGHALVHAQVVDEPLAVDEPGGWQVWAPAPQGASAWETVSVRVPYAGYLERLRQAYEEGQPAWQQSQAVPYMPEQPAGTEPSEAVVVDPVPGPWRDLVTFAFAQGVSVDPSLTVQVAEVLRREVLARLKWLGHDVQPMVAIHGHKDPQDRRQLCAFLGLPFVGHKHADGRLRGVAVALPHDLPASQRRALVAALIHVEGGLRQLQVPTVAEPVTLEYVGPEAAEVKRLESVQARRWVAPSRWWTTALPMVLDGFPDRRSGRSRVETLVAKSCRLAGLPDPVEVQVLRSGAYLPGAAQLQPAALRRKEGERPFPGRHVRVRFAQPVTGPVVIGSKRNFGLGLCVPTGPGTGQDGAAA